VSARRFRFDQHPQIFQIPGRQPAAVGRHTVKFQHSTHHIADRPQTTFYEVEALSTDIRIISVFAHSVKRRGHAAKWITDLVRYGRSKSTEDAFALSLS
jgi:hypothetical protein